MTQRWKKYYFLIVIRVVSDHAGDRKAFFPGKNHTYDGVPLEVKLLF